MTSVSSFIISLGRDQDNGFKFSSELADQNEWQFFHYDSSGLTESDIVIEYPIGKMLPTSVIIRTLKEEGIIYRNDYFHEFTVDSNGVVYQNESIVGLFKKVVA